MASSSSTSVPRDPNVERLGHVGNEYLKKGQPKKALECLRRAFDCVKNATEHHPELVLDRIRTELALCAVLSKLGQHKDAFLQCNVALDEAESLREKVELSAEELSDLNDCVQKGHHCLAVESEFMGSPSDLKHQLWQDCIAEGSVASHDLPFLERQTSAQSTMGSTWHSGIGRMSSKDRPTSMMRKTRGTKKNPYEERFHV